MVINCDWVKSPNDFEKARFDAAKHSVASASSPLILPPVPQMTLAAISAPQEASKSDILAIPSESEALPIYGVWLRVEQRKLFPVPTDIWHRKELLERKPTFLANKRSSNCVSRVFYIRWSILSQEFHSLCIAARMSACYCHLTLIFKRKIQSVSVFSFLKKFRVKQS